MNRCVFGVRCDSDAAMAGSKVTLPVTTSNESVNSNGSAGTEPSLSHCLSLPRLQADTYTPTRADFNSALLLLLLYK